MARKPQNIPASFIESSDEEGKIGGQPREKLRGKRAPTPMTVNAATSSSNLGQTTNSRVIEVSQNTDPVSHEDKENDFAYNPNQSDQKEIMKDNMLMVQLLKDINMMMHTMIGKQNSLAAQLSDLKTDLEVIKKSSARFQTMAPISTLKSVKRVPKQ